MKIKEYLKVVLILPGNVLITIPLIIFLFTRYSYSYHLVSPHNLLFYIAMFFLALGLWLAIWSVRTFYTKGGEGTPGPWHPVSNLIISGPYRYVRNPMILGVVGLLLFESALFTSRPLLLWVIVFFVGNIVYFKIFEEKELIKRFGSDYEDYKNKVSMLFPKLTPYNKE
jgi:protein-S-isoprenylcysteine O-methyltransferase Ste14|tara:strand:+ start:76 stop:582 length:507 start_codon:yes stop_codon:yes gene_type:complete